MKTMNQTYETTIEIKDSVGVHIVASKTDLEHGDLVAVQAGRDFFALQITHVVDRVDGNKTLMAFLLPTEGKGARFTQYRLQKATLITGCPVELFTREEKK